MRGRGACISRCMRLTPPEGCKGLGLDEARRPHRKPQTLAQPTHTLHATPTQHTHAYSLGQRRRRRRRRLWLWRAARRERRQRCAARAASPRALPQLVRHVDEQVRRRGHRRGRSRVAAPGEAVEARRRGASGSGSLRHLQEDEEQRPLERACRLAPRSRRGGAAGHRRRRRRPSCASQR